MPDSSPPRPISPPASNPPFSASRTDGLESPVIRAGEPDEFSSAAPALTGMRWWQLPNALALDAVSVAVVWLYVFAGMMGARLTLVNPLVLGTAVWLIYLLDRMADGWSGAGRKDRHTWAFRNRRALLPVMAAAAGAAGWAALAHMRWVTVEAGLRLAAAVGVYFGVVGLARWRSVSQALLLGVTAVLVMGLLQGSTRGGGAGTGIAGVELWRLVMAGALMAPAFWSLRHPFDSPPWVMVKKTLSGALFALGVALAPFSHLQDWRGLLTDPAVLLFGAACMLNSTGIRLWENPAEAEKEGSPGRLMRQFYPWLVAAVGGSAVAQSLQADPWSRPVLAGVAVCTAGFGLIHAARRRLPEGSPPLLADAVMLLTGLAVLLRQVP